jgi:hypothetical protein
MVAWRREQWAGNGGSKAMGVGKVAATAVRRRLAQSGRCPGSEADAQGPHGLAFSLNYSNQFKVQN